MTLVTSLTFFKPLNPNIQIQILHTDPPGVGVGGLLLFIYALYGNVIVNFLSQVIFVFLLFLDMVMYANEVETKEKNYLS